MMAKNAAALTIALALFSFPFSSSAQEFQYLQNGVLTGDAWGDEFLPAVGVEENSAIGLQGRIGWTMSGIKIYSPFDPGFGSAPGAESQTDGSPPFPCKKGATFSGYCPPGMDLTTCRASAESACGGASNVRSELFLHPRRAGACSYRRAPMA